MNPEVLYVISTISLWLGGILVLRAFYLCFRLFANPPGLDAKGTQKGLILALVTGLVSGVIGSLTPADIGRTTEGSGVRIPVIWFYAPVWGWVAVACGLFAGAVGMQAWLALNEEERKVKLKSLGFFFVGLLIAVYYFELYKGKFTVFRGAFFLSPGTLIALIALILLLMAYMAYSARKISTKGTGKTILTHLALIAGSILFGLPFAWLLSSSFKEDRDMSAGIKWIPQVTQKAKYMDPDAPEYEGTFEGLKVIASPIKMLPDGRMQLDIIRPFSVRGRVLEAKPEELRKVPREVNVVSGKWDGTEFTGMVIKELETGTRRVQALTPESLKGQIREFKPDEVQDLRPPGLRWQNFPEALQYLPPETMFGLVYLRNTAYLIIMTVLGTLLSCSVVAYGFSRLRFPGRDLLFKLLLATMMLPGAVTLLPQFLIFKQLGWIDSLKPLWVPAFFGGAFNVFLLRQFFMQIPMELEDAAKIDGCNYWGIFSRVMVPQIKPALAVVAIWTLMGTWNNFLGPLIYVNTPEQMPIAYALQLYSGERAGEPSLLMAFAAMAMMPILLLFFFAQKFFIEGVTLSGLGGR